MVTSDPPADGGVAELADWCHERAAFARMGEGDRTMPKAAREADGERAEKFEAIAAILRAGHLAPAPAERDAAAFAKGVETAAKWHDREAARTDAMSLVTLDLHKRSAEAIRALAPPAVAPAAGGLAERLAGLDVEASGGLWRIDTYNPCRIEVGSHWSRTVALFDTDSGANNAAFVAALVNAYRAAAIAGVAVFGVAFGETRLARANNLPRAYPPEKFTLYENGYLAALIFSAIVATGCLAASAA